MGVLKETAGVKSNTSTSFFVPFFLSWLLNGTVDAEKGILFEH